MRLPTYQDILAARARLQGVALRTPLIGHPALDQRTGGRILLKCENLQRVGAFKIRGAYNKIAQVDKRAFPGGIVACSSGNHAQGAAEAARLSGMPALIVMPKDAPALKIARTKAFGAEVHLYDRDREDRDAIARTYCASRKAAMVHPFDDPDIIAGQGTVGAEIAEQAAEAGARLDAVIVNASGGGLLSGISLAVKELSPQTEVYAAEPAGFDDFSRSLVSGKRERNARSSGSICDSLLMTEPGAITFAVAKPRVTAGLVVTDAEVREAVRFAFLELKLVVEPGGAVGLACVLTGKLPVEGRTMAVVLSGGNIDPALFGDIIGNG